MSGPRYDLEERLLGFAAAVLRLTESLPPTRAANHIATQLLRSGTSPLANHAEAQAAESKADFVHKLRICLKELRETSRWLRLIERIPLVTTEGAVAPLRNEAEELVRIFVQSIKTSEQAARRIGDVNR